MTDRKKKREVRNHFGFALEDGKINRLVDSFLLTNIQNMHKRTARACKACMFSQRFQHLSILLYIDISWYLLSIYRYANCRINDSSTLITRSDAAFCSSHFWCTSANSSRHPPLLGLYKRSAKLCIVHLSLFLQMTASCIASSDLQNTRKS